VFCIHGDAWDRFLTDHPLVSAIADWFYLGIQRMSRRLAASAKRKSKTFLRCVERVRLEATAFGKTRGADVIICGHTHHAEAVGGLTLHAPDYFNTGCWTDHHGHYLTVQDGLVLLEEVNADALPPAELAG
jgi:UDP-2,3-diacylglucosamine pyrophosphatase LpxH